MVRLYAVPSSQPTHKALFPILYILAGFLSFAGLASGQASPGTPSWSAYDTDPSGYTTINLQNLNVALNVPMMSKSGAFPLRFGLSGGDSYVSLTGSIGSQTMSPGILFVPLAGSVNGWLGYYAIVPQYLYSTSGLTCPSNYGTGAATAYQGWQILSVDGTLHLLPSSDTEWVGTNCFGGFTDQVTDGTGYTLSVTATGTSIYAKNGMNLTNNIIDSNGNSITFNGLKWTDTLGVDALNQNAYGGTTWTWNDVNGGTQTASLTNTTYTLRTAYGCPGWADTNLSGQTLPTAVNLPDGTSLALAWEQTPGYPSSNRTGRLTQVTLRDGVSKVSFNYNPNNMANDGIDCGWVLAPNALTRTTSDGVRTYTWTHTSSGNTTTLVDEGGNKTVYAFSGSFLAEVQRYVNTGTVSSPTYSSTPTRQDLYCYNGATSGCATASASLPIKEIDDYTTLGGMSTSSRQQTKFDTYGNVTLSARYDFGNNSATADSTTIIAYGSSNSGNGTCSSVGNNVNDTVCNVQVYQGNYLVSWNLTCPQNPFTG